LISASSVLSGAASGGACLEGLFHSLERLAHGFVGHPNAPGFRLSILLGASDHQVARRHGPGIGRFKNPVAQTFDHVQAIDLVVQALLRRGHSTDAHDGHQNQCAGQDNIANAKTRLDAQVLQDIHAMGLQLVAMMMHFYGLTRHVFHFL